MLIMKFFAPSKFFIFSFHGFVHVIESVMGSSNGKRCVLAASEEKLSRTVAVGARDISPLIDRLVTILAGRNTFGKKIFNVFNGCFSQTICFWVIWGRKLICNIMSSTPFFKISTKLGTPVGSDRRWPAE